MRKVISLFSKRSISGATAVEFALVAPVFMLMFFAIVETGLVFLANMTLEKAVKETGRLIKTGQAQHADMSAAEFRAEVCAHIDYLMNCDAGELLIDVRAFSNFGGASYPEALDEGGNLNPNLDSFNLGGSGLGGEAIVLMRVFYKWQLFTPLFAEYFANITGVGNVRLISSSLAFKNEPF
jgi:Flp pilus assembly protein TadG